MSFVRLQVVVFPIENVQLDMFFKKKWSSCFKGKTFLGRANQTDPPHEGKLLTRPLVNVFVLYTIHLILIWFNSGLAGKQAVISILAVSQEHLRLAGVHSADGSVWDPCGRYLLAGRHAARLEPAPLCCGHHFPLAPADEARPHCNH